MICLGIDPGTKCSGIAVVDATRTTRITSVYKVIFAGVATAKGRLVQDRLVEMSISLRSALAPIESTLDVGVCTVEWQKLRTGREKNPNSILDLTGIAGMAVGACTLRFHVPILTPIPSAWKGTISKAERQKRILKKVTLSPGCRLDKLTKAQRLDAVDAIGLAVWGHEQMLLKGKAK